VEGFLPTRNRKHNSEAVSGGKNQIARAKHGVIKEYGLRTIVLVK
jgi:hypothetical protein